jgi:probable rRNA maturation factor
MFDDRQPQSRVVITIMVQPRFATAGFAFATHFFQAWKVPGSSALLSSSYRRRYTNPVLSVFSICRRLEPTNAQVLHHPWVSRTIPLISSQITPRFSTRLFGSRSGSGILGKVNIDDDQTVLANIDQDRIRATVNEIRKHIGSDSHGEFKDRYSTYDLSIYLVEDEAMQEANKETRNVDKPTDILSFQFHDAKGPGILEDPIVDFPDYYNLGDIIIDVPYVIRSCEDDRKHALDPSSRPAEESSSLARNISSSDATAEEDDEEWVDDDRGVSYAMSKVFDPEQRIHMLLVHGLLHLVGYDHETDDDYELMVTKEDEILQKLKENGLLAAKESAP